MKYSRLQHSLLEWAIACHIVISGQVIFLADSLIISFAMWFYIFSLLELYKNNSFTFHLDPGEEKEVGIVERWEKIELYANKNKNIFYIKNNV